MRKMMNAGLMIAGCAMLIACGSDGVSPFGASGCAPDLVVPPATSTQLPVLGKGTITTRFTGEVDARGSVAYTTTWDRRGVLLVPGNAIFIWDVSGNTPILLDSVIVSGATTIGDVAISDDGTLLVVPTERAGGSLVTFDLSNPIAPRQLSRFTSTETSPGVHTAEIGRIKGRLYAFLSVDPGPGPAKIVIVDLGNPAAPQQIYSKVIGDPFVHDVFLRDGLLFLALWDAGIEIWDVSNEGNGSPSSPRVISSLATVGGSAHNLWWFHDPASGSRAYVFVGEEGPTGPAGVGVGSSGDIHVIDVCDMAHPREVAFYHVAGAGTHNFSMDESRGILYAAYYNAGLRALDVRGDLGSCSDTQRAADGRCNLGLMGREVATGLKDEPADYVWGVVFRSGLLYLSDLNSGLWKLKAFGF